MGSIAKIYEVTNEQLFTDSMSPIGTASIIGARKQSKNVNHACRALWK
jgi:hypothetical protein